MTCKEPMLDTEGMKAVFLALSELRRFHRYN